mgnify:FL=1|tara:strand:- start:145 stop:324 length:180 start_codon:yes stop_codon:yes gene_type:complete
MTEYEKITLMSRINKLQTTIDWDDYFIDYIKEFFPNIYNDACDFADRKTCDCEDELSEE